MYKMIALSCLMLLVACGIGRRHSGGDILVIGDSVMAWNKHSGADIGAALGAALGREVVNYAVSGSSLQAGNLQKVAGLDIPGQLPAGNWDWVVMNGGANDLRGSCGCSNCSADIDQLISPNAASGAIPDLIATARRQKARVLWVGYYEAPESSFKGCRPALVELDRRIAAHAEMDEGVHFVDAEDVFDPRNPRLFASDKTHPSAEGSALIGRYLARRIDMLTKNASTAVDRP